MSDGASLRPLAAASPLSEKTSILIAALVIAVLPLLFADGYWRTNLTLCAINVMLALGLDFILGYAGQLNLGHSAFYGLGAYASTLLIVKLGIPFWIAFIAAVAFSGAAGIVLSLFAVRLRGHYLAIASLGFAVITYQVLLNWISLTQGPLGIYGIQPPPPVSDRRFSPRRLSRFRGVFLPRGRRHALHVCLASSTCALPDRRGIDCGAGGRNIGGIARHRRRRVESICVWIGRRDRWRGRKLLRVFRRHPGAGRVLCYRSHSPFSPWSSSAAWERLSARFLAPSY